VQGFCAFGGESMARTYRSRNARPRMSRTDWMIAFAIAFPVAFFVSLLALFALVG
jgi:hypothetical protein